MTISQEKIPETVVIELLRKFSLNHVIFIKIGTRLKGGM